MLTNSFTWTVAKKREIWRTQLILAKIRAEARLLLTKDEQDSKRIFEGNALLRRMVRYGLLTEEEQKLDFVLQLTTQRLLERRLQTKLFKQGLAKSVHHARVLLRQRHVRVGRRMCNVPSFMIRTRSEKNIEYSFTSPFGGGRPGRVSRKKANQGGGGEDEGDEE